MLSHNWWEPFSHKITLGTAFCTRGFLVSSIKGNKNVHMVSTFYTNCAHYYVKVRIVHATKMCKIVQVREDKTTNLLVVNTDESYNWSNSNYRTSSLSHRKYLHTLYKRENDTQTDKEHHTAIHLQNVKELVKQPIKLQPNLPRDFNPLLHRISAKSRYICNICFVLQWSSEWQQKMMTAG